MLPAALLSNVKPTTQSFDQEGTIITTLGLVKNLLASPSVKSDASHVEP